MKISNFLNMVVLLGIVTLLTFTITHGQSKKALKQEREFFKTNFYSGSINEKSFNERVNFTNVYGWIVLPVKIKDNVYNFLFDSGAPSVISEDLVKKLNLKSVANINTQDAIQNKTVLKNIYRIDSLQLGNITFLNEGCIGSDMTSLSDASCANIDGVIGANLMRDCIWTIDYSDSSVTFSNQLPGFSGNYKAISFKETVEGGIPVLPLAIGDTTVLATLDYGNNGLSSIPRNIFLKTNTDNQLTVCGNGVAMVTLNQTLTTLKPQCRAYLENFKLGGESFEHQLFDVLPENSLPLIGAAFLSNYKVTLDWGKHKVYLVDATYKNSNISYYTESFGIKLSWENGKTVIGFLWNNSDAANQGISVGEQVMKVNEYNDLGNHDNFCAIQKDVFFNKNIQQIQVTLKDKNQNIKTYTLKKERLFDK